jgi:hypothetical protein
MGALLGYYINFQLKNGDGPVSGTILKKSKTVLGWMLVSCRPTNSRPFGQNQCFKLNFNES